MNVTFCGHSQITKADNIANWLRNVTQDLIEQGATTFYLGGYGEFDSLAASILREQKKKYPQIELVLVLAYLNTGRDVSGYDSTVYPPLENVPRRFSISHRNRWMVESADVVVAYVLHDWGGAATTLRCAKQTKNQIIMLLNEMGIDVEDYRYDEKEEQLYTVRTISGEKYELPFNHESDGTRKLIAALPVILVALQEGRLVIIDELDAKLHPKLLRYVISMFKNKKINKYGAQLLFTSHDIATMKNTVFRRDEIWFAALDENHSSQVYSLYEIRREDKERVNSTAAFDKQYLEGRYGADPYLQNMLSGGEWI